MLRYYINGAASKKPGGYGDFEPADASATNTQGRTQSLLEAWTHTLSPGLLSWLNGKHAIKFGVEGRFGYNKNDTGTSSSGNFRTPDPVE